MSYPEITNSEIDNTISTEAIVAGGEVLDQIRELSREDRLVVVAHLMPALVYEVMGDDCSLAEIGELLDASHTVQSRLEHYSNSTRWKIEEDARRAQEPDLS